MAQTFFLRRTRASPARDEYFYLTAEQFGVSLEATIPSPKLPGSEGSNITGPGSPNFFIPLGIAQVVIRVTGYLMPVPSTEYPTLSNPDVHVITVTESNPSGTGTQTVSGTKNGKLIRARLFDYVADQPKTGYSAFKLGMPDWGADSSGSSMADSSIASTNTRLWEGVVKSLNFGEVAGEPDQYMYSIEFVVGDV